MAQQPIELQQLTPSLASAVSWQGEWADGTYEPNSMVIDGDWTMIATVQTTDRAAPQTKGTPEDSIAPGQALSTASNSSVVKMVHNFTMLKTGWLQQLQVRIPFWDLNSVSRVTLYNVTTGSISVINNPILRSDDWVTLSVGNSLFEAGTVGEVWFEFYNSSDANNINGGWTTNIGTGIPISQEFNIDNVSVPTVVEINHTDLDSNNRSTELDGVTNDSVIVISETGDTSRNVEVKVTAVDTTSATSTKYTVTLLNLGAKTIRDGNTCTISIDIPITQPSQYSVITDYYLGSTNQPSWATVVSRLYFDGVQQGDVDDAYGINILFQEASFSPDWDVVATSNTSGAAASSTGFDSIARKASEETRANTAVLANDTSLQVLNLAEGQYSIEMYFRPRTDNVANFKFDFFGGAVGSINNFNVLVTSIVGTVVTTEALITASNVVHVVNGQAGNPDGGVWIRGTFSAFNSGGVSDLIFRWAQNTSNANTTRILSGAYMRLIYLGA